MFFDEFRTFINEAAIIESIMADVMLDMEHNYTSRLFIEVLLLSGPQSKVPLRVTTVILVAGENTSDDDHRKEIH